MREGAITTEGLSHKISAEVLARLGAVVLPAFRLAPEALLYVPAAMEPSWTERLPLPVGGARRPVQTVALADGRVFTRVSRAEDLERELAGQPRTQVYESVHLLSGGWIGVTALRLACMLGREVVCTIYQSRREDSTLGPHHDTWDGVVVQMSGMKRWLLWPDGDDEATEIIMRSGDVLIVPRGMRHDVSTLADPGHSIHLVLAVLDVPLAARPGHLRAVS
ncbi:JmjC domain-containing protein [Streptomyces misionensis]|uniref:JmjC domain-containing protein n=1 Tax=Streptomyces misionensis TaxID=67331 RepID=UPI0033C78312